MTQNLSVTTPTKPTWREIARKHSIWIALSLVLFWGGNFSVQKYVLLEIGTDGFLLVRYALLLPICCVLLLLYLHRLNWPRVTRSDMWLLAKMGFLGHFLHVTLVAWGMSLSTPFSSSLILAIGPVFSLLILRYSQATKLSPHAVVGVVIAFVGALLFMSDKLLTSSWKASAGDLVLLVAAFMFSLHTILVRDVNARLGIVTVMTYSTLISSLPIALLALVLMYGFSGESVQSTFGQVASPFKLLIALAYSIVISAFAGWIIWAWVNVVRGSERSAPLMYLMPPVAGTISWLAGGEVFTAVKIGGAAIALLGVAIAQQKNKT